jgi:hypothetical protein
MNLITRPIQRMGTAASCRTGIYGPAEERTGRTFPGRNTAYEILLRRFQ